MKRTRSKSVAAAAFVHLQSTRIDIVLNAFKTVSILQININFLIINKNVSFMFGSPNLGLFLVIILFSMFIRYCLREEKLSYIQNKVNISQTYP